MDEKQVQELIDAAIGKALGSLDELLQPLADKMTESLREYLDGSVATLEERLETIETAEKPAASTEGKPEDAADNPLEARLAELEGQLKAAQDAQMAKDKEAMSLRFNSALSGTLDKYAPNCKPVVAELLQKRYEAEAKETKKGLLVGGKTLEEVVDGFFKSSEGAYFLPSDYTDGAGVKQPTRQRSVESGELDQALMSYFGG